jgi:hypothetical protein
MTTASAPITSLIPAHEQHMLLLFMPLRSGQAQPAIEAAGKVFGVAGQCPDSRPSTGVHFSMSYHMPAGAPSPIVVPTFQAAPGVSGKAKDLLVVLSIYDADFGPYIGSFFDDPAFVKGLTLLLQSLDEDGLVALDDPTSAAYILAHGGVKENAKAFYQLLMRYNFADPTIPAVGPGGMANPPSVPSRYTLGATFPGLTVGKILDSTTGYPDAGSLWPSPEATPLPPPITYEPSTWPTRV